MRHLWSLLILGLMIALLPGLSLARMRALGEEELDHISARSGISGAINMRVLVSADTLKISDTDSPAHWIELDGFTIDDGAGNGFCLTTPDDAPLTVDVATEADGRTLMTIQDASAVQPRYFKARSVLFDGQNLGSLAVGPLSEGPSTLRLLSHADGATGVDWDYQTRLDIGNARLTYNTSPASLSLNGFHLLGSASANSSDDPADPSTWVMEGTFRVGDLDAGAPATFDVATDLGGLPSVRVDLPMQGSLRIEDVSFGGADFGPMALDGIDVHRLNVRFTP